MKMEGAEGGKGGQNSAIKKNLGGKIQRKRRVAARGEKG